MTPAQIKLALAAATLAGAFAAGWFINGWRLSTGIQEDRAVRAETVVGAVAARVAENAADEKKHAANNEKIEGNRREELAPVILHIADAPRLRVGSAVCTGSVAGTSEAESPTSGDAGDTTGWLVRQDVDRDIRALKLAVENHLATARACQQTLRDNGLMP